MVYIDFNGKTLEGAGPDDPQRSLLTPNILWFCERSEREWQSEKRDGENSPQWPARKRRDRIPRWAASQSVLSGADTISLIILFHKELLRFCQDLCQVPVVFSYDIVSADWSIQRLGTDARACWFN